MKKRLIKKWMKRYVHPHVNNLPKINVHSHYEYNDIGNGLIVQKLYTTKTIVNGHIVQEGCVYPVKTNVKHDIMRTGIKLFEMISTSDKSFLRIYPEFNRGYVYVRIATEAVI